MLGWNLKHKGSSSDQCETWEKCGFHIIYRLYQYNDRMYVVHCTCYVVHCTMYVIHDPWVWDPGEFLWIWRKVFGSHLSSLHHVILNFYASSQVDNHWLYTHHHQESASLWYYNIGCASTVYLVSTFLPKKESCWLPEYSGSSTSDQQLWDMTLGYASQQREGILSETFPCLPMLSSVMKVSSGNIPEECSTKR